MFNTERFICEIEARPALYDISSREYSNREFKSKCWFDVGRNMFEDWDAIDVAAKDERGQELMKKWKALRDNFVREHKAIKRNGKGANKMRKYVFYDRLLFLAPHLKDCNNSCSDIPLPPLEDNVHAESSTEFEGELRVARKNIPRSGDSNFSNERNKRQRLAGEADTAVVTASRVFPEGQSDEFGNKAFLLSFAPIMDSFPPHVSLRTRMKIAEIFTEAAYEVHAPAPLVSSCHIDYDEPSLLQEIKQSPKSSSSSIPEENFLDNGV